LKSFPKIRFAFRGHNLAAAAAAGMMERQTKFRRYDVNGQGACAASTERRSLASLRIDASS
jgi:hypothetical protein